MTHRKSPFTGVLIGLVATIAGLLLLESLSRVVLTARADLSWPEPDWYQYTPDVGWERRPHFNGLVAGELRRYEPARYQREFDADGFFSIDSDQIHGVAGHKKILAIGDSNTFGWGVPSTSAFAEVLDSLRADADVINLGVSGHSSFQGYEMLVKHFDQVRPDVIIASYGFNDRRAVPSEDTSDSRQKFERDAQSHRFDHVRGKVYLFRMVQIGLSKLGLIKNSDQDMAIDARRAATRVSPERYRRNLERIAQFCKERHVPLMFIVFNDNPAQTEHLRAGIAHQNGGRYQEAEAELRIALTMDNWFSDLARKHLAGVLEQRGAAEEAAAIARFSLPTWALAQGGKVLRLDADYNEIMRSVAKNYGATIVEAGRRLSHDASLYIDLAHPDERGHRLIAELLHQALDPLLNNPHATFPSASEPPRS